MIKYTRKSVWMKYEDRREKIHKAIKIHKIYIILWSVLQLTNFVFVFVDNVQVKMVHGITVAFAPFIISITFLYSILLNGKFKFGKKRKKTIDGHEVSLLEGSDESENSINNEDNKGKLVDSLLILNPTGIGSKDSKLGKYIDPAEKAFEYQDTGGYWDISQNFKEVLRREVLEYIVKAFGTIFEMHRRDVEDQKIVTDTMIELKPPESVFSDSNIERNEGCWKSVFGD